MSFASSHSEVISRKPSGSCLIHPSISSSSSDYDEGEELDLLSETPKEPSPNDLLVGQTGPQCLQILTFSTKAKGILHLRRRADLFRISCAFAPFFVLPPIPNIQFSSKSLRSNRRWKSSHCKHKTKSNRRLSANAFSPSFSQNRTTIINDYCKTLNSVYACTKPKAHFPGAFNF